MERIKLVASLREYFKDSVAGAMESRRIDAGDQTAHYVVNLLTLFARSEALFDETENGRELRPLAAVLAEAASANRAEQRNYALQRVGDVALFVAGFLCEGMARRLVDVDYYVWVGGSAYGTLSQNIRGSARGRVFSSVFAELADKFQDFVDVLAEVRDAGLSSQDADILRMYEIWLRTGSRRAASKLRSAGIEPNRLLDSETRH
jgi:hypothetical protein